MSAAISFDCDFDCANSASREPYRNLSRLGNWTTDGTADGTDRDFLHLAAKNGIIDHANPLAASR